MPKYENLVDDQAINGHLLSKGTVVELEAETAERYRRGGICLSAVKDDDERDVKDVSERPGNVRKNDGHQDEGGKKGGIPPGKQPSQREAGPVVFTE